MTYICRSLVTGTGLLAAVLASSYANAADQGITGKKLLLKSNPKMVLLSKDALVIPGANGSASDPRCVVDGGSGSGASVKLNDGTNNATLNMPCANWSTNGSGTLYKYKDAAGAPKVGKIKAGLLKVVSPGMAGFPVPGGPAIVDVEVTIGADKYCMEFNGSGDGAKFLVKDAAVATCPSAVCGNNSKEGSEECDGTDATDCPGNCQPDCTCVIGQHTCTLDSANSQLLFDVGFTTLPITADCAIDFDCGAVDGTGKAPCDCSLQSWQPFQLGALGWVCVTPSASTCATGEIDCNGGDGLDVTLVQDHIIGTCTSQVDCEAQCASSCGADVPFLPQCEGFCLGGSNNGAVCTNDSACPDGGQCPGPNGGHVTAHHCQCGCLEVGGAPSSPGDLQCELGMNIVLETALPCDGTDVFIVIGDACVPVTTAQASGVIVDANLGGGTLPTSGPWVQSGVAGDCTALQQSGVSTGIRTRGTIGFHDTTLGDMIGLITLQCQ